MTVFRVRSRGIASEWDWRPDFGMLAMEVNGARILVTGASGYIGEHLIRRLRLEGAWTTVFCRSSRLREAPHRLVVGDIRDYDQMYGAMDGCDAVIHLACVPIGDSFSRPVVDFEINGLGTFLVAKAANALRIPFVNVSSSAVYGAHLYLPIDESHPTRPLSPYGGSKLCGEIMCHTLGRMSGNGAVSLRLSNVYGPWLHGGCRPTVETIFLRKAIDKCPMIIRSHPANAFDFIFVSDVIEGLVLAVRYLRQGLDKVVNIGTGVSTSLLALATRIGELSGSQIPPTVDINCDGRPVVYRADITRARRLLGFVPKVSLDEGLSMVLDHLRRSP